MAQAKRKLSHEELGFQPTEMEGFYTRPSPPHNFDPTTASEEELAKFGLPKRPDQKKHLQAHALWHRVFGRRLKYIQPVLQPRRYRTRAKSERTKLPKGGPGAGSLITDNWAGAVSFAAAGQTLMQAQGQWTLPSIWTPEWGPFAGADEYCLATWVGLDGYGTGDVLQAGVDQFINYPGIGNGCLAWIEFFPSNAAAVSNFPVSPGDFVSVWIQYLPPPNTLQAGQAIMVNVTQGAATVPVACGSPDVFFGGKSAEWIVESPQLSNGDYCALPGFSPVAFFAPWAYDSGNNQVPGADVFPITLQNYGPGYGRTDEADSQAVADPMYGPNVCGVM